MASMNRQPLLPVMLYAAFAAMSLGILLQQIFFSLFMLTVIFAGLFANLSAADVFLKSRRSAAAFFAVVITSALYAQIMRPIDESVKFHWAFIAVWAISPTILQRLNFRHLHRTMLIVSAFGLAYSCYWLLQPDELQWALKVGFSNYPRAEGFVSNPITHAETLMLLAAWSLARLSHDSLHKVERNWITIHLTLSALVIIFSRIRSGMLAMVVLLLLYTLLSPNLRHYAWRALAVVALISIAAFLWFGFNLASIEERMILIRKAGEMFQQRPILGIGPDRFDEYFTSADKVTGHPHNTLIGVAVETGLIGLTVYLAMMAMLIWQLWQLRPMRQETAVRVAETLPDQAETYTWVWRALVSTVVMYWVFGLFDYNLVDTELLIAHGLHWSLITALYARFHTSGGYNDPLR